MASMKCPHCDSEDIQFATNTHGGGFSFFDSCCGFILMGPLGLLCGACGSGVSTKEFWICKNCGHKFSNKEAQRNKEAYELNEKNAETRYYTYKSEINSALKNYGNIENLMQHKKESAERYLNAKKNYEENYESFLNNKIISNKKTEKTVKRATDGESKVTDVIIAALILIGLVTIEFGLGVVLLAIGIILWIIVGIKNQTSKKKLDKMFMSEFPNADILTNELKEAAKENEKMRNFEKMIEYCEDFEKQKNI